MKLSHQQGRPGNSTFINTHMLASAKGEKESRKGKHEVRGNGRRVVMLDGEGDLTEKVTFLQRTEGSTGASHVNIWKKSPPNREKSKCRGPEVHMRS